MTLLRTFTRTAVLSFGFAVAIGTAEATPLSSDRDMVTGVSVTEADCRALIGRLWVELKTRVSVFAFGFQRPAEARMKRWLLSMATLAA
jgi:hypothetical protein